MEQFSLEKYLASPSRKVVTRDGSPVRILCTDKKSYNEPVIVDCNHHIDASIIKDIRKQVEILSKKIDNKNYFESNKDKLPLYDDINKK